MSTTKGGLASQPVAHTLPGSSYVLPRWALFWILGLDIRYETQGRPTLEGTGWEPGLCARRSCLATFRRKSCHWGALKAMRGLKFRWGLKLGSLS